MKRFISGALQHSINLNPRCRPALVCLVVALAVFAQPSWRVTNKLPIGGQGGWDYLTLDPTTHRMYVPRSTHTMVIDSGTGHVIADIPGQKIAHGVTLVPEAGRGYISDGGGDGAIIVFDLKTNAVLGSVTATPDADGIIYDPATRKVVVVSGDKGVLMTLKPDLDPRTGKIDPPIELGGAPEFLAADGAGRVYVNLMDKNEVAVVDLKGRKVTARWPVAPGGAPVGMSLDAKNHRLFIGCRKPQQLVAIDTNTGKVVSSLPIGAGVDAVKNYSDEVFASCGDGTLTVARQKPDGTIGLSQTLNTQQGARTMDVDAQTGTIYLPAAEFDPPKSGTGRPVAKPGSFMIVVAKKG
jgi:DNA-binding beta-propeller fold protein YncE